MPVANTSHFPKRPPFRRHRQSRNYCEAIHKCRGLKGRHTQRCRFVSIISACFVLVAHRASALCYSFPQACQDSCQIITRAITHTSFLWLLRNETISCKLMVLTDISRNGEAPITISVTWTLQCGRQERVPGNSELPATSATPARYECSGRN